MLPKESSKAIRCILSLRGNLAKRSTALNSSTLNESTKFPYTSPTFQCAQRTLSIAPSSQISTLSRTSHHPLSTNRNPTTPLQRRFHTEADFHTCADETLEDIQDLMDEFLEEHLEDPSCTLVQEQVEINYSSGVLTIALPPVGTWVLNKQTPNRQIWWSSPRSGPRRYEWDDELNGWVSTKFVDYMKGGGVEKEWTETIGLEEALRDEIEDIFDVQL